MVRHAMLAYVAVSRKLTNTAHCEVLGKEGGEGGGEGGGKGEGRSNHLCKSDGVR